MENLDMEQMNTSECPVQDLEELGDAEALSKVTGAGTDGTILGSAIGGVGGFAAGTIIGHQFDKKGTNGKEIGAVVGAVSGAAIVGGASHFLTKKAPEQVIELSRVASHVR